MSDSLTPEDVLRRLSTVSEGLRAFVEQVSQGLMATQRKEIQELQARNADLAARSRNVVGVVPNLANERFLAHNMGRTGLYEPQIIAYVQSMDHGFQASISFGLTGSRWCIENAWFVANLAEGEEFIIHLEQPNGGGLTIIRPDPADSPLRVFVVNR